MYSIEAGCPVIQVYTGVVTSMYSIEAGCPAIQIYTYIYMYIHVCLYRWFHGKLSNGRSDAERLLMDYRGDNGAFLVRESTTFTGDFSLSFV